MILLKWFFTFFNQGSRSSSKMAILASVVILVPSGISQELTMTSPIILAQILIPLLWWRLKQWWWSRPFTIKPLLQPPGLTRVARESSVKEIFDKWTFMLSSDHFKTPLYFFNRCVVTGFIDVPSIFYGGVVTGLTDVPSIFNGGVFYWSYSCLDHFQWWHCNRSHWCLDLFQWRRCNRSHWCPFHFQYRRCQWSHWCPDLF